MTFRYTHSVLCPCVFAMAAVGATLLAPFTAHAGGLDERVRWCFEFPSDLAGAFVAVGVDGTIYATDNLHLYALTPSAASPRLHVGPGVRRGAGRVSRPDRTAGRVMPIGDWPFWIVTALGLAALY